MKNILDRINGRSDTAQEKKKRVTLKTQQQEMKPKTLEIQLTEPSKTTGLLHKEKYTCHYDS